MKAAAGKCDLRKEYDKRTADLEKIIRPLRTASYECDFDFRHLHKSLDDLASDWGGLDLNPDFQRGHVWSPDQQRHYIENILRGVVSTSGFLVQFNCPNWDDDQYAGDLPRGFQCIDGLQRITAVLGFMHGLVMPFGLTASELDNSRFSTRGAKYRLRVAVHNFQNKADLLQHYLDLNAGGTPHSMEEIERVMKMRNALITS